MGSLFDSLSKLVGAADGLANDAANAFGQRTNDQKAADGMRAYAGLRGLTYEGNGSFDRISPLLNFFPGGGLGVVSGALPGGVQGKLGHYSRSEGSAGDGDLEVVNFALVQTPLPEAGSAQFLCMRRTAGRGFETIVKTLANYRSVELESEVFRRELHLFVKSATNDVAVRQLFSPSFIVFLSEDSPPGFWFEVANGHLMCATRATLWDDPAGLDALCLATAKVATTIRDDIANRAASPPS